MAAVKSQSVRASVALMSAATVSPCPVRAVAATASAACSCPHLRPQFVRRSPGFSIEPTVSRCCTGRGVSAMRPATRLRHFPRESLIARLSSGEVSIVKVELTGQRGSLTLTTRSEPHNRRAIHAEPGEPGADADWTRIVRGPDTTTDMDSLRARPGH